MTKVTRITQDFTLKNRNDFRKRKTNERENTKVTQQIGEKLEKKKE